MSLNDYQSYKATIIDAIMRCNKLVEEHRKALSRLDFELDDLHAALESLQKEFLTHKK